MAVPWCGGPWWETPRPQEASSASPRCGAGRGAGHVQLCAPLLRSFGEGRAAVPLVAHGSLASTVPESRLEDGGRREAGQIPAAGARRKRVLPSLFAMLQMGFLWLRYIVGALISTGRAPSNLSTLLQQNEFKASSARRSRRTDRLDLRGACEHQHLALDRPHQMLPAARAQERT